MIAAFRHREFGACKEQCWLATVPDASSHCVSLPLRHPSIAPLRPFHHPSMLPLPLAPMTPSMPLQRPLRPLALPLNRLSIIPSLLMPCPSTPLPSETPASPLRCPPLPCPCALCPSFPLHRPPLHQPPVSPALPLIPPSHPLPCPSILLRGSSLTFAVPPVATRPKPRLPSSLATATMSGLDLNPGNGTRRGTQQAEWGRTCVNMCGHALQNIDLLFPYPNVFRAPTLNSHSLSTLPKLFLSPPPRA